MVSTAAVADNITWENTGPYSAEATMTYMVANASGIFTFSPESDFIGFEALRNYNRPEGATLRTWVILVPADGFCEFVGIRIPPKSSVIWKLKEGDLECLTIELTQVHYNH